MTRFCIAATLVIALCAVAHAGADRLSLEGMPAPRLEGGVHLGRRTPSPADTDGKVVLLFFWAHWCIDCKADSASVASLVAKYKPQGLTIVAPTRLYGISGGGRPAAPQRELRYLLDVRDKEYPFLRDAAVPVSDANYEAYGIDSIPTYILIDRQGIIRLDHAGRMSGGELDEAVRRVLQNE
jgi:thiol-disulfide isomerase/thioredoxin